MTEMGQMIQDTPPTLDTKYARKVFSKIGLTYLLCTILIYLLSAIGEGVLYLINPALLENMDVVLIVSSIMPMYLVGFPLIYFVIRKLPVLKPEKVKFTFGQWIVNAIICLGLAYTSNIIGSLMTTAIGNLRGEAVQNVILDVASSVSPWMILIYMVILAPIGEELMFRKLIVDRTARYSKGMAILLSGLMFGLYHGNLNQFIYAFVIGCFFAFLYVKTGNIKISISMHMVFNFIGGFLATYLLKLLHLEDATEVLTSGDASAIMELFMINPVPWIVYCLFIMFVLGTIVVGVILFIVFAAQGKYKVTENPDALPKGIRAKTFFGNVGMILFIAFWVIVIVAQLCGVSAVVSSLAEKIMG